MPHLLTSLKNIDLHFLLAKKYMIQQDIYLFAKLGFASGNILTFIWSISISWLTGLIFLYFTSLLNCQKHIFLTGCYHHVMYKFQSESTLYSLPECQGTPCSKQAPYLEFKWQWSLEFKWQLTGLIFLYFTSLLNCQKHIFLTGCYHHVMYKFQSESTFYSLPECQGTPCSKQAPYLEFKWQWSLEFKWQLTGLIFL